MKLDINWEDPKSILDNLNKLIREACTNLPKRDNKNAPIELRAFHETFHDIAENYSVNKTALGLSDRFGAESVIRILDALDENDVAAAIRIAFGNTHGR